MLCGGSIGLQADTVTLASGMPLEFPAPPSLQILAIARYRCGLRLVWHENPSLLFVPPRMKHYTRYCRSSCAANNFPPSVFPAELPDIQFFLCACGTLEYAHQAAELAQLLVAFFGGPRSSR